MPTTLDGFSIDVGSDQDHERLVADVYYLGRYVCSVTEEGERGKFDFEINAAAAGSTNPVKNCPLDDLLAAIAVAADRLRNL